MRVNGATLKSLRVTAYDKIVSGVLPQKSNEVEKVGIEVFHRRGFGMSRPLQTHVRWRNISPTHWDVPVGSGEGAQ